MDWKKISIFAPLLSAAVVGGCIAVTLSNYTPPVYEVKAEEPAADEADQVQERADEEKEEEASAAGGEFDLEDGIYRGVGNGFAGTITVSVEIKDKKIVAIEVLDVEGDDAAFFNRAKGVIDKIISSQSLDVDVVSGATYSSRGIISAVKNALTGEKDSSESPGTSAGSGAGSTSVGYVDEPSSYRDGTYYGTGTGFGGPLTVKVDISGGKITSIQITQHSDGSSYVQKASGLISSIIAAQSTNVDTVSGATYSSVGIIEAVRNALSQAAGESGNENQVQNTVQQSPQGAGNTTVDKVEEADAYRDGTYYGTGTGFGGTMKIKVDISGGKIAGAQIMQHSDGNEYIQKASSILQTIIAAQSTNVDTVSGATYSSVGIIEAVRDALKQAAVQDNNNTDTPSQEQPGQTAPAGTVPYIDGIYYGTGEGYMGNIKVAVVIQEKTIKAILIMENEGDDEAFLDRAKAVAVNVVKQQNTDVDIVSGATYSSQGILDAIKNALEEARKATSGETDPDNPGGDIDDPEEDPDDPAENPDDPDDPGEDPVNPDNPGGDDQQPDDSVYEDGEYTAQVICQPDEDEDFEPYMLSLKMVIQNDEIISISDVQGDGEPENASYIRRAANGTSSIPGVLNQILEKNGTEEIDTVSRATCSSKAIIEACNMILEYARRQPSEG